MSIISDAEQAIEGWPDEMITAALVAVGLLAILVALFARPIVKPLVLAWVVMP